MWGALRATLARAAVVVSRAATGPAAAAALRSPVVFLAPRAPGAAHAGFKTKSCLKKRFRLKASGAVVRRMSGKHHKMLVKTSSHRNRLSEWGLGKRMGGRVAASCVGAGHTFSPLAVAAGFTNTITTVGIRKKYTYLLQVGGGRRG